MIALSTLYYDIEFSSMSVFFGWDICVEVDDWHVGGGYLWLVPGSCLWLLAVDNVVDVRDGLFSTDEDSCLDDEPVVVFNYGRNTFS